MTVFRIYVSIILEFLLELYVFYALSVRTLKRAPLFAVKAAAGLVLMAGAGYGAAAVYSHIGGNVFGRIAVYVVLFALSTLHVKACFAESYRTVLFLCGIAYAAQNLVYKVFLFFWCLGERLFDFDAFGAYFDLFYRLIYYAFWALAATGVYFLFLKKLLSRFTYRKLNARMFFLTAMTLAVTVVLCSFEDVYFARLSTGRETQFGSMELFLLRETGNLFSVVSCAFVLLLAYHTTEEDVLRSEIEYLQYAVRQGQRQYEISRDTIELVNLKCHDIKYRIGSLRKGASDEEIADLQKTVSIYDANVATGNPLLDVLFTEKSLYCEQNGITFSCMADGEKLSFMTDGDLYCLFGNIIDNALEAVMKIREKERRVINLIIKAKDGLLTVQEDNYFDGELDFRDGLPVTTKDDARYHGFGTRSIRMLVRRYDGEMTAFVKDDVFHLNLLFSLGE